MKTRTKLLLFITLFLILAFPVWNLIKIYKPGATKNAEIVINNSNYFSEEELNAAVEVALNTFKSQWKGGVLHKIEYTDELYAREVLNREDDGLNKEGNAIVFYIDFYPGPQRDKTLPPAVDKENWLYIFDRDNKDGEWRFKSQGV